MEDDYCPTELDESLDGIQFKDSKSSASCKISEIKGFTYGGVSSRFWMLRKHINNMKPDQFKKVPFYSWNCITIQLEHRDVDLVIRNEYQMKVLLKFLIHSLKTIDGE